MTKLTFAKLTPLEEEAYGRFRQHISGDPYEGTASGALARRALRVMMNREQLEQGDYMPTLSKARGSLQRALEVQKRALDTIADAKRQSDAGSGFAQDEVIDRAQHQVSPVLDVLADTLAALEEVAAMQHILMTTELQRVDLKPDEFLMVKIGDRATGWIPDPSHEQRLLELLAQVALEVPSASPYLVYHYGVEAAAGKVTAEAWPDGKRLKVRIADNVLDDKDWPIRELVFVGDEVVAALAVYAGVYSFGVNVDGRPLHPGLGWTLEQVAAWSAFDSTGHHPESYHEVWEPEDSGRTSLSTRTRWQSGVTIEQLTAWLR